MADISKTLPLQRPSVQLAHERIKGHIHRTPVLTSTVLSKLVSTPQWPEALVGTPWEGQRPAHPRINLFFKCENYQRIGAFKIRGAFHALSRLSKEELARGVVTHSSGRRLLSYNTHRCMSLIEASLTCKFFHRQPCASPCPRRTHLQYTCLHCHAHNIHAFEDSSHKELWCKSLLQRQHLR